MSADEPSVEELNTDRRMEILTDDEIADIQRQLDCHQVVDNDLVQAALATIANLRSRLSHPTLSADRNVVIEECALKVRHDCAACEGTGNAGQDCECEYCGRPMQAIRALKQ